MKNETDPTALMTMAAKAIKALDETQATPGEKAAALKTAAFAIEQAATVQQIAIAMANILQQKGH